MNALREENTMKYLTIKVVVQMLLVKGLFELIFINRILLQKRYKEGEVIVEC